MELFDFITVPILLKYHARENKALLRDIGKRYIFYFAEKQSEKGEEMEKHHFSAFSTNKEVTMHPTPLYHDTF